MNIKVCLAIFLAIFLAACNKPVEPSKSSEPVAVWYGPWLFWEGQLRVHALQFCDQQWHINSADIWQQGVIELPCTPAQKLTLNSTLDNQVVIENIAQWLSLPSSDYAQWQPQLKRLAIIDENGQWIWGKGRLVLFAGALNSDIKSLDNLWRWHQLDSQAQAQGGAVQILLNQHDIAALAGDVQFNATLGLSLQQLNLSASDAFGLNSEWGRWLRQQSVALKFNDVLLSNVMWAADSASLFSDIDTIASTLRMGLHTRFRLYSDAQVAALYAQMASESSTPISHESWQTLQEQWQIKQWLTAFNESRDGLTSASESAWLWQNGTLQKVTVQ